MTSLTSTNPLANAPVTSQDAAVACAPTRGFDVTDAKPATIAGKKGYTCRTSAGTASGSRIDLAFLSANDRLFECILYEGAGHGTYDDFVAILRSFKLLATGTTAYPSSRASTANTFGYVLGTWVNNDAHTQSVTRIVIDARGGYCTVKPFSPCPTDECDWDATMVAPGASSTVTTFRSGVTVHTLLIAPSATVLYASFDAMLQVFHRGSGAQASRQPLPDDAGVPKS